MVPILRLLPRPGRNLIGATRKNMYSIGSQIVAKSKADMEASEGEKDSVGRRDLLSILLQATLSKDIPETQRLSDTEVVSQIPTFFFAGNEICRDSCVVILNFTSMYTTSSATAWALHAQRSPRFARNF
ncbi:hypothetical protein B0H19DRAFT_540547 [Mycena capillaripes]|nr:hypothetical protein B0H19DRAFT_540547 [Mycena capillaripes]